MGAFDEAYEPVPFLELRVSGAPRSQACKDNRPPIPSSQSLENRVRIASQFLRGLAPDPVLYARRIVRIFSLIASGIRYESILPFESIVCPGWLNLFNTN